MPDGGLQKCKKGWRRRHDLINKVWAQAMVPMLFVLFLVPGVVFGIANGTIRNDRDVAH